MNRLDFETTNILIAAASHGPHLDPPEDEGDLPEDDLEESEEDEEEEFGEDDDEEEEEG